MIKTMDRRLLVPATMAIGGSAIAIATWIGQGFGNALGIEIVTVVATIGYFVLGGRDSDFGAIFGSRPDERQANIDLRATAFTGMALTLLAIGGVIVTTAMGKLVWPFMLFAVVGGVTYVVALLIFRHR
jgi:hypothetical protein